MSAQRSALPHRRCGAPKCFSVFFSCLSAMLKCKLSQNTLFLPSSSSKKQWGRDDLGGWSVLLQRHRFLLTMLMLLAFLCTVYLYFAITLGETNSCAGLSGDERASCLAKSSLHSRKLKFF
uniref:Uncharacterized protein n=1 Tax=Ananas comosus var. bracteatus TaxID=296719 RepID=A0A6V7PMC0_ANACO|nr:unnamed protein product [Ananas comosus var. bracteatus]